MCKQVYLDAVSSTEYDFLRNNPNLGDNIMYMSVCGSNACGLASKDSDLDIRGIVHNTPNEILTMNCVSSAYVDKNTDTVLHTLSNTVRLLKHCNPGVMEMFFVPEECVIYRTDLFNLIKDNIDLFISKIAFNSYGKYAESKFRALKNNVNQDKLTPEQSKKMYKNCERLVTLIMQGTDLLSKGYINVVRQEIQLQSDIRKGIYSLDEIITIVQSKLELLNSAYLHSKLSSTPDTNSIERLIYEINLNYINSRCIK